MPKLKGYGNKTYDHEPIGHPALQKPRAKGGIPVVTRDHSLGVGPGKIRQGSNYDTHIKFPGNKKG